jgi:hypothetical protein
MAEASVDGLDRYRQDAGLSHGELFLRYFELWHEDRHRTRAFLYGVLEPGPHD